MMGDSTADGSSSTTAAFQNKTINLRHKRVGPKLLHTIQQDTELRHLWMGPTFSSAVTMETIVAALPGTLESLDLDLSLIADRRIRGCSATLQSKPFCWYTEMQHLFRGLEQVNHLSLRFPNNGDTGALAVAEALKFHPGLETLDLRGNRISDTGVVALAKAMELGDTPNLRTLILSWNAVGNTGANAIAKMLPVGQLERLDLSCNELLDDAAVQVLSDVLQDNVFLRELVLCSCPKITTAGAHILLNMLQHHNATLQRVNLRAMRPTRHDPRAAAATLSTNNNNNSNNDDDGTKVFRQVEYWLSLNRSGRYLLHGKGAKQQHKQTTIPVGLWAPILAKTQQHPFSPSEFYFLLRENPNLCSYYHRHAMKFE